MGGRGQPEGMRCWHQRARARLLLARATASAASCCAALAAASSLHRARPSPPLPAAGWGLRPATTHCARRAHRDGESGPGHASGVSGHWQLQVTVTATRTRSRQALLACSPLSSFNLPLPLISLSLPVPPPSPSPCAGGPGPVLGLPLRRRVPSHTRQPPGPPSHPRVVRLGHGLCCEHAPGPPLAVPSGSNTGSSRVGRRMLVAASSYYY
eukprot:2098631-Rhodomonas_salina.1